MSLFVDTSVWSLALRRDAPAQVPEVRELTRALEAGNAIFTTGLVLQELLQGFSCPKAQGQLVDRFAALPLLVPDRQDYIDAAGIRNTCRRKGVQFGTIDALLAQLCIRHQLILLSADRHYQHASRHVPLKIWGAPPPSSTQS